MRGTKRQAIFESTPVFNSNNSVMQSKRFSMESPFIARETDTSVQRPSLDKQRAESSRQHVRALNSQFASWIQTQSKNHPDELWEDGLHDYLNHAKSIMEKFHDVVDWLKANASKGASVNEHPSTDAQVKLTSQNDKTSQLEKPGFPSFTTESFGTPWRPGVFGNNTPLTFGGNQVAASGNANSIPSNDGGSNEADGGKRCRVPEEDDVEEPTSPSLKKGEEKGIITVQEVKCKLYVKATDPADKDAWKDKGTGQLSIKCKEGFSKGTKESKPTVIIRNDAGKVLLNALLYPGIKTNLQKKSLVAIFHTADGDSNDTIVSRTYLIRTKNDDERDKLASAIQECTPTPAGV